MMGGREEPGSKKLQRFLPKVIRPLRDDDLSMIEGDRFIHIYHQARATGTGAIRPGSVAKHIARAQGEVQAQANE